VHNNTLHLGKFKFEVEPDKSTLSALISNATNFQLFWMINTYCQEAEIPLADPAYYWAPRVYWESMRCALRDWRKLEGKTFLSSVDNPDDPPAIYLESHEDLDDSEIHFTKRHGTRFDIDWRFVWVDRAGYSGADEPRYAGRLLTSVELTHVSVWLADVDTENKAKERLGYDLDLSLFSEPQVDLHPSADPCFTFRPVG
jgi:hypothetical protein